MTTRNLTPVCTSANRIANSLTDIILTSFSVALIDNKLEKMAPSTHDHNIVVKVLEKRTIVDKTSSDKRRMLQEEVLVGDDTGCMYLNANGGKFLWRAPMLVLSRSTFVKRLDHIFIDTCDF